jgi:hypothetical protein
MNPPSRIVTPERRSDDVGDTAQLVEAEGTDEVTRTALFTDKDGSLSAFWSGVSIVAIFLLVWPPIFGIVVWQMKFASGNDSPLLGWLALVAIYAYMLCMPSALLAGLVHAVATVGFRYNSILVPVVAAVGAAILLDVIIVKPVTLQEMADAITKGPILFLFASLIASVICWRVTRRFARVA